RTPEVAVRPPRAHKTTGQDFVLTVDTATSPGRATHTIAIAAASTASGPISRRCNLGGTHRLTTYAPTTPTQGVTGQQQSHRGRATTDRRGVRRGQALIDRDARHQPHQQEQAPHAGVADHHTS